MVAGDTDAFGDSANILPYLEPSATVMVARGGRGTAEARETPLDGGQGYPAGTEL